MWFRFNEDIQHVTYKLTQTHTQTATLQTPSVNISSTLIFVNYMKWTAVQRITINRQTKMLIGNVSIEHNVFGIYIIELSKPHRKNAELELSIYNRSCHCCCGCVVHEFNEEKRFELNGCWEQFILDYSFFALLHNKLMA